MYIYETYLSKESVLYTQSYVYSCITIRICWADEQIKTYREHVFKISYRPVGRLDDRLRIRVGEADKRGGRNKNIDMEFFFTENCLLHVLSTTIQHKLNFKKF